MAYKDGVRKTAVALGAPQSSRRVFLRHGALVMGGLAAGSPMREGWAAEDASVKPALRLGLMTDVHYADRDPAGSRHYRESLGKVAEAVEKFNDVKADLAFEIGDFIDAAPEVEQEIGFLTKVESVYKKFRGERHYVLGNHCVFTLKKEEFVENCGMPKPHYSFDKGRFHFVVLDACYREDGVAYGRKNFVWTDTNISDEQVDWLRKDLDQANKPTLVFVHQRLDLDRDHDVGKHYAIKNAAEVRSILERSGKVLAVLQGHSHENHHQQIRGVHYCVLRAVVEGAGQENNGYAIVDLFADGSLRVEGFGKQEHYRWTR